MKATFHRAVQGTVVAAMAGWLAAGAWAIEDGLGTNHIGLLRVDRLELDGAVRTAWPVNDVSVGGTVDFRQATNAVAWAPAFCWDGQLLTARLLTDGGEADVQIVRAAWNDPWDTYEVVNEIQATASGVEDATWSSSWVSNRYRLGVVVIQYTDGTNLWWSVDCRKTEGP